MQGIAYIVLALALNGCLAHPAAVDSQPGDGGFVPDPFCPYPSEEIYFYSDPDDCSKYIECYEGVKYIRDCATGLYWSEEEIACDYPKNVDCATRPNGPTTQPPQTSTSAAPVTTTEEPIITTVSPSNLCVNEPDGTYLADPTNCKRFYECRSGKAIIAQCPVGTLWHEEILNCDYPENVHCQ